MGQIFEHAGWPAILITSACLCLLGFVTLFYMFAHLLHRGRRGCARRMVAIFGTVGLLVPAGVWAVALMNDEAGEVLRPLWPTSVVAMIGEQGDPVFQIIVLFGVAVLSNVGLYGFIRLLVGGAWNWIYKNQSGS